MCWTRLIELQKILVKRFLGTLDEVSQDPRQITEQIKYLRRAIQFLGPQSLALDRANRQRHTEQIGLFECLMMHRLKASTDPRDKIYAIVGLTRTANDSMFVIDYKLPTRQVYINTVDYLLRQNQKLDIILAQTKGFYTLELPTWVPDFSSTGEYRPIPFRYAILKSAYSASAIRKAEAVIDRG
jgi:hypothetical protein